MRVNRRLARRAICCAVCVVVIIGAWLTIDRGGWDWLVAHETRARGWLANDHPWGGFLLGLTVFTWLSFVPGLAGKTLVVGWLFGFWRGLAIANVGLTVAALGEFWLSRYFVQDAVESRFGYYLRRTNASLARDGAYYLFAMRVAHVPYTVTNYLMGATRISTVDFWWSTQFGILPGNILFCYAGAQLPTLHDFSRFGLQRVLTPTLLLSFVLLAICPMLLRWAFRRACRPAQDHFA